LPAQPAAPHFSFFVRFSLAERKTNNERMKYRSAEGD
jgi:hypothetical protein